MLPNILDISTLKQLYRHAQITPVDVVEAALARCEDYSDKAVWISRVDPAAVRQVAQILSNEASPAEMPLWGTLFGVKDNIDYAECLATAACSHFLIFPNEMHLSSLVSRQLTPF